MTTEEQAVVEELVGELIAAYEIVDWTPERCRLFARELGKLGIDQARVAVRGWLEDEERPPTPAGLRRKARERDPNPYVGTEFEHFPVLWECRCGEAHRGTHAERPVCPNRKGALRAVVE